MGACACSCHSLETSPSVLLKHPLNLDESEDAIAFNVHEVALARKASSTWGSLIWTVKKVVGPREHA
jgi:hypothetical protein